MNTFWQILRLLQLADFPIWRCDRAAARLRGFPKNLNSSFTDREVTPVGGDRDEL